MQHHPGLPKSHALSPQARSVLACLRQPGHPPLTAQELGRRLPRKNRKGLQSALNELERAGLIRKAGGGHSYLVAKGKKNYIGRLSLNPRGFGFVQCDELPGSDVMIPARHIGSALHGDLVSISLLPSTKETPDQGTRLAGRINHIQERADHRITGILRAEGDHWWLMPSPNRFGLPAIRLSGNQQDAAQQESATPVEGAWAMCRILEWTTAGEGSPVGLLTRVFPPASEGRSPYFLIEARNGLPGPFPEEVEREAGRLAKMADSSADEAARVDLRHMRTITIDPTDAGDFDDAISLEVLPDGNWLLGVHIADVSHFVQPGSGLDREAYARGNSVYLPGKMIPMLPKVLCQDLLSLRPHEDRRTISVLLEYTPPPNAVLRGRAFELTLIRSAGRLTYEQVEGFLKGAKPLPSPTLEPDLNRLADLAGDLRAQRMAHGAVDLDVPELEVVVDPAFEPLDVRSNPADTSHRLIEEMMLAANKAVADEFQAHNVPCLFRVHDAPPLDRLMRLNREVAELGLTTRRLRHRSDLQRLIDRYAGTPVENTLRFHVLRAMSRACYSPEVRPHYGLAESQYLHFTSPIRRYADLLVHRALRHWKGWPHGQVQEPDILNQAALHLTDQEGKAQEAEREATRLLTMQYLDRRHRAGQLPPMEAVIRTVHPDGVAVELLEYMLNASIHPAELSRCGYKYMRKLRCYQSRKGGDSLFTGGTIQVQIKRVDFEARELWVRPAIRGR